MAVLTDYIKITGPRPAQVLEQALEARGLQTRADSSGGEHSAQCPAHDDQLASLRWRETLDRRVLLFCHAGCAYDDVLAGLGLKSWQLQPVSTTYYWDAANQADREKAGDRPIAAHVRQYTVNEGAGGKQRGGKQSPKFVWQHRALQPDPAHDEWRTGRGPVALTVLWRAPALAHWLAESVDRSDQGGPREIWLVEGEKDAYLAQTALDAMPGARMGDAGAQDGPGRYFVTTGGEGAAQDPRSVILALRDALVAAGGVGENGTTIVLIGDRDEAGVARVEGLAAEAGVLIADGCSIKTMFPAVGARSYGRPVRDLGQILDKGWTSGSGDWLNQLVPELGGVDPYQIASLESGELYEVEYNAYHQTGLATIIVRGKDEVVHLVCMVAPRVTGVEYDQHMRMIAWHITWTSRTGRGEVVHHERISREDIRDGRTWAGVVVRTGGDLLLDGDGALLRMVRWLKYHSIRAPQRVTYPLSGWNWDETSGEWVHVDYEHQVWPQIETETGVETGATARTVTGATSWSYGLEAVGEAEAAKIAAEMVWYREPQEIVPLIGALAANAVRPIADKRCGLVRMVQVAGRSGLGKTTSVQPVVRLFGSTGWGTNDVSVAALGRIAQTGTGPYWLDDPTGAKQTEIVDFLRGASTGGGRTRANMNGIEGTDSQVSEIFVVWSSEAALAADEKAMRDRILMIEFHKHVEDRISVKRLLEVDPDWVEGEIVNTDGEGRRGDDGRFRYRMQWADLQERGVGSSDHQRITRISGWVVRGLWQVASAIKDEEWTAILGSTTGKRAERSGRWVRLGTEVMARWLEQWGYEVEGRVMRENGQQWAHEYTASALAAHDSGADTYLVQNVLPALLAQISDESAILGRKLTVKPGQDVRVAVRDAHVNAGRVVEQPALWVTFEGEGGAGGEIWINSTQLAIWAKSDAGRRAGIDQNNRHLDKRAIDAQLVEISAAPTQVTLRNRTSDGGWARGRYRVLHSEITRGLLGE